MYNGRQAVEGFLRDFAQLLSGSAAVVLVIDRVRYSDLYDTVLSLGGRELRLETEPGRAKGSVLRTEGPNTRRGI
jgi:hypothetical protein